MIEFTKGIKKGVFSLNVQSGMFEKPSSFVIHTFKAKPNISR